MTTPGRLPDIAGRGEAPAAGHMPAETRWDVFMSYATEDKETVARPLAEALTALGVSVWYDEFELRIGDSVRRSIDSGITRSKYGLAILSEAYFEKAWPQRELDGLVAKTTSDKQQILLTIWHEISREAVFDHSPSLADVVALSTVDHRIDEMADKIAAVVRGASLPPVRANTKPLPPTRSQAPLVGTSDVTLTAGPSHHFFSGVTVTPHSDRQGRFFLDVRKNNISSDDYVRLCDNLATTPGADGWHAHLDIGGRAFDFNKCEVTPNDTARGIYYVDVRASTDDSGYRQVLKALATAAKHRS